MERVEPPTERTGDDTADAPRSTRPSEETKDAERADAHTQAGADAPPTEGESRAAPAEVTDAQRAHAEEMLERGAHQQGEGRIP